VIKSLQFNIDLHDVQIMSDSKLGCACANQKWPFVNFIKPQNLGYTLAVLQNHAAYILSFMCILRAAHSWFNQGKSIFAVKNI
jgi:hypothetical protein